MPAPKDPEKRKIWIENMKNRNYDYMKGDLNPAKRKSVKEKIKSKTKGQRWTEERKKQASIDRKGRIPWNKNKKCPQISKALKLRRILPNNYETLETKQKRKEGIKRYMKNNPEKFIESIKKSRRNQKNNIPESIIQQILNLYNIGCIKQFWIERKIYDFYVCCYNLLIEVDGDYWHSLPDAIENDKLKNEIAERNGFKLLRIKECDIKNKDLIIFNLNKIFTAIRINDKIGLLEIKEPIEIFNNDILISMGVRRWQSI